jgi:hypothetical protein
MLAPRLIGANGSTAATRCRQRSPYSNTRWKAGRTVSQRKRHVTAWALRDHDRIRIRRYAPLLLVGVIATAVWIAGLHGEFGWGFSSEVVAAVLISLSPGGQWS